MKYLFFLIIPILSLYSCNKAKIESVNGVFTDEFKYKWNSPWMDKSNEYLKYEPFGSRSGLKIRNISDYHTGLNYYDFPVKMMDDFEMNLKFIMFGENTFTLFIGYKDPQHRESFSFSKRKKEFRYTRFRGKGNPLRLRSSCEVNKGTFKFKKGLNKIKLIKKNNEVFVYHNNTLLMHKKNLPSFCNSFGFGLGPKTSVYLRKIEIIETNFKHQQATN